ncbi:F-box/LRR-repeat protein 2 [Thecamonas trahens ATCC 50062]|uniref:F-box/LRR-repeat protein 2 n=1 Tax=Thecamonas trahens ATCC 50062 TaxID=461836 RepID=A0A0L0DPI8_THETB|nr:F-box/LRR-repeat protein 2 [Thecamonas trahens ATCC 50062]KNC53338.1 F-box/LRR-repeat protein 2 [Thecamonas trahens ATCC 50062]|eukprot:XP_013754593.1 F-box/LRR-repeat protein 2 [Thecamonas trahens ATCC 50062]
MAMVVAEMCPNLTTLDLFSCSNITDAAVVALAGGCPNLTSLRLDYCSNITDAAVVAVAGGCPNLTFLDLYNCSNIILCGSVVALAGGCPNLTFLGFGNCSNITDAAVVTLAGGCPNLTILLLGNCFNITDAAVVALAGGCPNLTTVRLDNCSKVTLDLGRARTTIAQPDFPASQHAHALLDVAQAHVPHPVHAIDRCNLLSLGALNTLLANGADLYDLDDDNKHAYVHSPASSAPVFVDLMIESLQANADGATKLANGINKATLALFVALRASPTVPISADIVSELVTAGADVNAVEPTFNTPVIHVAAANTEHGALKALLEAVAALDVVLDQSAVDGNGATVLDTIIAANQLTAEAMAELGGVGLDPFTLQPDNTHVYVAAPVERSPAFSSAMVAWIREHGDGATELTSGINKATLALFIVLHAADTIPFSIPVFTFLINSGADINALEPSLELRPLHIAVSPSNILATMALLAAGADVWALGTNGETAMSIASAVLNKPGSDTNAAAKEVYNLIVGTSSIPERVADHVRETIAAGGDIGGGAGASAGSSTRVDKLEAELADTKAELADTKVELADTRTELADTKAELADTKAELADTKAELADVRDHVTIATGNIAALQADRANILQHVDKAITIFQARR